MERLAKVLKARLRAKKSGFTLVELLIVIMIIAILAGMLLLATGSATDTATATKIINDMRAAKSAALLIYMDSGQSWDWAKSANADNIKKSLDRYMDRPLFGDGSPYSNIDIKNDIEVTLATDTSGTATSTSKRDLIGFTLGSSYNTDRIKAKLQGNAGRVGLYDDSGKAYTSGNTVYMVLQ